MLEYLHLKNVGPAPEMELELAPRLNLLTGDNGLGKTFLLDIAWWAITQNWPADVNPSVSSGRMALPNPGQEATIEFRISASAPSKKSKATFNRREQAWEASRLLDSGVRRLLLYAQVDGGFALWDSIRNGRGREGEIERPKRGPGYVFTPREAWDGLPLEPGPKLCKGLIEDWGSWQRENGNAFSQLTSILEALSPPGTHATSGENGHSTEVLVPGELTRISLDDVRDMPTLRMPYGQDAPIVHSSAGMRRIIALAYLLVWAWQEHQRAARLLEQAPAREITFLIDEIEAHLHPRWQRTIVRALLNVMQALAPEVQVQLIVATHSPLVMASVEPWFNPDTDAWFDLDLVSTEGGSTVQLQKRPFLRRGDVSNWLTSNAFDLRVARSEEAEQATLNARALLTTPVAVDAQSVRAADQALRSSLPEIDPFWVRWSAFAEPYLGKRL